MSTTHIDEPWRLDIATPSTDATLTFGSLTALNDHVAGLQGRAFAPERMAVRHHDGTGWAPVTNLPVDPHRQVATCPVCGIPVAGLLQGICGSSACLAADNDLDGVNHDED